MLQTQNVAIVGAGNMGHGFAAHFVIQDKDVTLIDHRQPNLDEAEAQIRDVVAFLREEGLTELSPDDVVDAIDFTLDTAAGVDGVDLVVETVSEDLDTKHEVFADFAPAAPDEALLASNTSGIPITDIAKGVPEYAERVVGCHWWFPPYLLPTVEVIRGELTSDETLERMEAFVESVDRIPLTVEKDAPGFLWNRIQHALFREAIHIAEEGIASLEDVNRAIRDGYAIRTAAIGPIETIDIAGLDLTQTVGDDLYPHLCDDDETSDLFDEYLERGRGGIEDGAGFFEYDEDPSGITQARDEQVMAIRRALTGEAGLGADE
ncbi:3-hydroxyacyl-CoA dehydrogenase family protein [Halarchaeum salinum]|uniref:3-hydroxyacyl-CoA dehydrogenase NAD-binding domain-containing protein n=1 Tax=Halarchaeum salinum TaxID=489912 RepID=A0AAV3S8I1_9EURY